VLQFDRQETGQQPDRGGSSPACALLVPARRLCLASFCCLWLCLCSRHVCVASRTGCMLCFFVLHDGRSLTALDWFLPARRRVSSGSQEFSSSPALSAPTHPPTVCMCVCRPCAASGHLPDVCRLLPGQLVWLHAPRVRTVRPHPRMHPAQPVPPCTCILLVWRKGACGGDAVAAWLLVCVHAIL
jgi:hypothetical protein